MPDAIKVSDLTPDELSALEASGADLSRGTVPVPQAKGLPRAVVGDAVLPTSRPVDAPEPPAGVIARARERLAAAESLAGPSSFEEKSKAGETLRKQGDLVPPRQAPDEDVVAEADKATFLIAMLGGSPFRKSYKMFGGRLEVTFQTRGAQVDAACAAQAYKDDEFEPLVNIETTVKQQLRMNRYFDYQFVASLHTMAATGAPPRVFAVETTVPEPVLHGVGASKLRASRINLDKEIAQPMRVALRSLHSRFENMVATMTMEANNPDFWQADSET